MNRKISKEIQAAQDHGRQKHGRGPKDYAHDDGHCSGEWHDMIETHLDRLPYSTPLEWREELIKIAGLAISAAESFDRKHRKRRNK